MKFGFYLMGQKGLYSLKRFVCNFGSGSVSQVVSSRDAGLVDDSFSDIEDFCRENSISFFFRSNVDRVKVSDFSFAIGWRWLIHNERRLIVFHDSILPKYRGFSPLVNMLIDGRDEIGVSALYASDEYDTGEIIAQKTISISYPIKIDTAINLISPLYGDLLIEIAGSIFSDKQVSSTPQTDAVASYSLWRDEIDYEIDWSDRAENIMRFCNAVGYPYKGASTQVNGKIARIFDVEVVADVNVESRASHIGKVIFIIEGKHVVVCGCGLLKINSIVFEGNFDKLSFRTRYNGKRKFL